MIILLVTCLIINIFFGSLLSDTFSDLKLNVFIITGFTSRWNRCYVKQVLLINPTCIYPTFQRGWGLEFCLVSLGRFQNSKKVNSVNLSQISLLNMWLLVQIKLSKFQIYSFGVEKLLSREEKGAFLLWNEWFPTK